MKWIVLLLVLALAFGWLMLRSRSKRAPPVERQEAPKAVAQMLACAHCGLHLPRNEAHLDAGGRAYCSTEHRDAGPR
jgi:uncharacterized protein